MVASQPNKHLNDVIDYVNTQGKWTMSDFHYRAYIEIATKLSHKPNPYLKAEGLLMLGLTHFSFGQSILSIHALEQLLDFGYTINNFDTNVIIGLYLPLLVFNARIDEAMTTYEKHYQINKTNDVILAYNYLKALRLTLNPNCLDRLPRGAYDNQQIQDEVMTLRQTVNADQTVIQIANINPDIVKEVLGVATRVLINAGKFNYDYKLIAYEPDDTLTAVFYVSPLSIELMHELNEAWLNAMVEHQSTHDFSQLSRVLVNFRPMETIV